MKYKEGATNETLLPSPRPWPQNLDMISFSFNSLIIVAEALLGHLASEKDSTFLVPFHSTADERGWLDALDIYIRIRDIIFLNGAKDRYFFNIYLEHYWGAYIRVRI